MFAQEDVPSWKGLARRPVEDTGKGAAEAKAPRADDNEAVVADGNPPIAGADDSMIAGEGGASFMVSDAIIWESTCCSRNP